MQRMRAIGLGLAMVLAWSHADAAVVICSKKGKLTLRTDTCKGKETAVPATELGVAGPKGDKGDTGDQGDAGPAGLSGVEVVTGGATVIDNAVVTTSVTASCPTGKRVLGGGGEYVLIAGSLNSWEVISSAPITTAPQGWRYTVRASASDDYTVAVYAVCANAN